MRLSVIILSFFFLLVGCEGDSRKDATEMMFLVAKTQIEIERQYNETGRLGFVKTPRDKYDKYIKVGMDGVIEINLRDQMSGRFTPVIGGGLITWTCDGSPNKYFTPGNLVGDCGKKYRDSL